MKITLFGIWHLVFLQKLIAVRGSLLASPSVKLEEKGGRLLRNICELVPDCSASRVIRQRHNTVYTSDHVLVSYLTVCTPTLLQAADHFVLKVLCSNRDYC